MSNPVVMPPPLASTAPAAVVDDPLLRPRRRYFASFVVLVLAFVVLAEVTVALLYPPDGQTRGPSIYRFLGRLHPMLVHAPIGLLLVVPLLEFCGIPRRFRHLQAAAGFVLWLGAILAVVAAAHGYLLARFDGTADGVEKSQLLRWHLWFGITTAGLSVLTVMFRLASVPAVPRGVVVPVSPSVATAVVVPPVARRRPLATLVYVGVLFAMIASLSFAGHLGGQMSYGEEYLSEFAPPKIAPYLGSLGSERATNEPEPAHKLKDVPTTVPSSAADATTLPVVTPAPTPVVVPPAVTPPIVTPPVVTPPVVAPPVATSPATVPVTRDVPAPADEIRSTPAPTTLPIVPPVILPATPTTLPATLPVHDGLAPSTQASAASPSAAVSFDADVMPVLQETCVSCHGPSKVKGDLRLDSLASLRKGGESGEALVPGDANGSDLYHRMTLPPDDDDVMPPHSAKRRPTPEQIEVVRRWILEGAKG